MMNEHDAATRAALAAAAEEHMILSAQLDALQANDRDAQLMQEIRLRFGIERRLQHEMGAAVRLQDDLHRTRKREKRLRELVDALVVQLDVAGEHEVLARVRDLMARPA